MPKRKLEKSAPNLAVDDSTERIGERLRQLRGERDLTIADLAGRAGVSAGIISQIERGKSNPSIKTLQALRSALGVNLWEFLDNPPQRSNEAEPNFIRRRANRPRLVVGETHLVKELLSPHADETLRFMFVTLPPGGVTEDVLIGRGQKGGYVVDGSVEVAVGGELAQAFEGDSFQFRADLPHKISNRGETEAKILWIMSVVDVHL